MPFAFLLHHQSPRHTAWNPDVMVGALGNTLGNEDIVPSAPPQGGKDAKDGTALSE